MHPVGAFFLAIFILLLLSFGGWVGFTQYRARRLGLPAPSWQSYFPFIGGSHDSYGATRPSRGGILGWIDARVAKLRPKQRERTAGGAYEQGRGLEPDDVWDARVPGDQGYRHDDYYNESELEEGRGARAGDGAAGVDRLTPENNHSERGYQMNVPRPATDHDDDDDDDDDDDIIRGRSRSRDGGAHSLDTGATRKNPFDDAAAISNTDLRGVSPRPMADLPRK